MAYCPLCLKDLEYDGPNRDVFRAFSVKNNQRYQDHFHGNPPRNWDEDGLLVQHRGCKAANPFYIPQAGSFTTRYSFQNSSGQNQRVDYPLLHHLEMVQNLGPPLSDYGEMWYPAQLYRLVNEGAKCTSIKLCGGQHVGKTVLATVAMVPSSYPYPNVTIETETYIYLPPSPGPDEFLSVLYPIDRLRQGLDIPAGWSAPTATNANLRAVMRWFTRAGRGSARVPLLTQARGGLRPQDCVIFYDSGGELTERTFSSVLDHLNTKADVQAVVMDSNDLSIAGGDFSAPTPPARPYRNSIPTAYDKLATCNARLRPCLVVTKLDALAKNPQCSAAYRDQCDKHMRMVQSSPLAPNDADRQLLSTWLDAGNDQERQLSNYLRGMEIQVFVVWTENAGAVQAGFIPKAFGLTRFIEWCVSRD